jgi:TrmH RNA methyltransferase
MAEHVVCGWHAVVAALQERPDRCRRLLFAADRLDDLRAELASLARRRVPYRCVPLDELERAAQSRSHQGVVALFERRADQLPSADELRARAVRPGLWLALDGVGNPHNLGAIARTAAFLGVDALLTQTGAGVHSSAALRTAEGALERLPVLQVADLGATLALLAEASAAVLALDVRAESTLAKVRLPKSRLRVLVAGAEETGLSPAVAAACPVKARIRGTRSVESLNVGAAVAIALAHLTGAA